MSTEERGSPFPPMDYQDIFIDGAGWKKSAADIVLSSAGWVAVTFGGEDRMLLRAHTPYGKGIFVRQPALFEDAVNQRGSRERYGNRTAFLGYNRKKNRGLRQKSAAYFGYKRKLTRRKEWKELQ